MLELGVGFIEAGVGRGIQFVVCLFGETIVSSMDSLFTSEDGFSAFGYSLMGRGGIEELEPGLELFVQGE